MHGGSGETAGPRTERAGPWCSDRDESPGTKQRRRRGNQATHTVWFIGSSSTHTRYVHKHKYSNVHIYTGRTDRPSSLSGAPALGPRGLRLRTRVRRGPALEGRSPEEGEVLLPSPHRHLQRVLSLLHGTPGQEARRHALGRGPAPPPTRSPLTPSSPCLLPVPASQSASPSAFREEGPQATESVWPLCPGLTGG